MASSGQDCAAAAERIQLDLSSAAQANNACRSSGGDGDLLPSVYDFAVKKEPFPSISETSTLGKSDVVMREGSASASSPNQYFSNDAILMPDMPSRHQGHRRAHSEVALRLYNDMGMEHEESIMFEAPTVSDEASDDLFSMYIDVEQISFFPETSEQHMKQGSRSPSDTCSPLCHHGRSVSMDGVFGDLDGSGGMDAGRCRPVHHHSGSMDESVPGKQGCQATSESSETKRAMAANKLAELALLDPKRAKRILANRQSASRSKERKVRYISDLERKVQTLQTEATTLSAQVSMLQRDTSGLMSENSELKLRLQSMEQQAQLCDALNDALREEVQRLKVATQQLCMSNKRMIPQASQQQKHHHSRYQARCTTHMPEQGCSFQGSNNGFGENPGIVTKMSRLSVASKHVVHQLSYILERLIMWVQDSDPVEKRLLIVVYAEFGFAETHTQQDKEEHQHSICIIYICGHICHILYTM